MVVGRYADQLLDYAPIDLTDVGVEESMRERDELNRSINIQLPEALIDHVRAHIVALTRAQQVRKATAA
ncbi:radical SAM protein [Saccharothrix sp. SC076]|nr:radical SAM protein [Saccharothrix obliqua]